MGNEGDDDDKAGAEAAPKFVTDDQLAKRFRDFEKRQEKALTELATTLTTSVTNAITAAKLEPTADEGKAKDPIEDHPTVKGLQKQVAEMEGREKRAREDADRERGRARDVSLRQRLHDALVKGGIDAGRTRHAMALLVDGEKRVRFAGDDDDALIFRDADEQDVDFATGLRSWLRSDDAKLFMRPQGLNGSGDRNPGGPRPPERAARPAGSISRMLLQMADGATPGQGVTENAQ